MWSAAKPSDVVPANKTALMLTKELDNQHVLERYLVHSAVWYRHHANEPGARAFSLHGKIATGRLRHEKCNCYLLKP